MRKLIDKLLSFRGDEYRPFAIEVSADEIRLAVYGGARGFDEAPTAQTASHTDLESCLLEGIDLLDQARLFSPSREPYYRRPQHRCVFFRSINCGSRIVKLKRRVIMRAVPRKGDIVTVDGIYYGVADVVWNLQDDQIHLNFSWGTYPTLDELQEEIAKHLDLGWSMHSETDTPPTETTP